MLALGFSVFAINPKQADRYRDRYSPAGSKDDRRDALVFATAVFLEPQALRIQILEAQDANMLELRGRRRMREHLLRTKQGLELKIRQ